MLHAVNWSSLIFISHSNNICLFHIDVCQMLICKYVQLYVLWMMPMWNVKGCKKCFKHCHSILFTALSRYLLYTLSYLVCLYTGQIFKCQTIIFVLWRTGLSIHTEISILHGFVMDCHPEILAIGVIGISTCMPQQQKWQFTRWASSFSRKSYI